jgi:hypothetical protein
VTYSEHHMAVGPAPRGARSVWTHCGWCGQDFEVDPTYIGESLNRHQQTEPHQKARLRAELGTHKLGMAADQPRVKCATPGCMVLVPDDGRGHCYGCKKAAA